jgi:hypothetical protein
VRGLSFAETAELAERALAARDAEAVERLIRPLGLDQTPARRDPAVRQGRADGQLPQGPAQLDERRHAASERVEGRGGVLPVGPQA